MKRSFLLVLLIFFSILSSFALDNNRLSIRLTPGFSLINGEVYEYVFTEANQNTGHKESELDWDVKAIPAFTINAQIDLLKYIHTELRGSVAIPKSSGNMQDYDWLNSSIDIWINDDPCELTNYSIHDNKLLKYTTFFIGAGFNIKIPAQITLTPIAAYYYDFISFDGTDGYKTYKGDKWQQIPFEEKVISYKQEINDFLLGISVQVETLAKWYFYGDFFFSPSATALNAVDYHYVKNIVYWDKFKNISQLQQNCIVQFKFNKYHSIGISESIQNIPVSKGTTSKKYLDSDGNPLPGSWIEYSSEVTGGGTSRFIWSLALNYSFSL